MTFDTVNHRLYILEGYSEFHRAIFYNLNNDNSLQDNLIDGVIGQADLYHGCSANRGSTVNNNTLSIDSLWSGKGIYVDSQQNLWISDQGNNRVLRFPAPIKGDGTDTADKVIGQANYTTSSANRGGSRSNKSFNGPAGLFLDASENLWVADSDNNRILRFPAPVGDGNDTADKVIGQADFTSASANRGVWVAANSLSNPIDIFFDGDQSIYIIDQGNNSVLHFSNPLGDGTDAADKVVGQANFTSKNPNRGLTRAANTLSSPLAVAKVNDDFFIVDTNNHRVLRPPGPLAGNGSDSANLVLGQDNFASGSVNKGMSAPDGTSFNFPREVFFNGQDQVLISDFFNGRVIVFNLYPIDTSITINGGDSETTSVDVTLTLSAHEVSEMIISEDTSFSGASWEQYSATKTFILSSDVGIKTIYAKFRNSSGDESPLINDTIEYKIAESDGVITSPDNGESSEDSNEYYTSYLQSLEALLQKDNLVSVNGNGDIGKKANIEIGDNNNDNNNNNKKSSNLTLFLAIAGGIILIAILVIIFKKKLIQPFSLIRR